MGREVRRVPEDWEHPRDVLGRLVPLRDHFDMALSDWRKENDAWSENPESDCTYEEWDGPEPWPANYMPDWPEAERTHLMMYECTTEGTPISPAFKTPEELARWLVDNRASANANDTATYEQWLSTCKRGWAVSGVIAFKDGKASRMESGVAAFAKPDDREDEA